MRGGARALRRGARRPCAAARRSSKASVKASMPRATAALVGSSSQSRISAFWMRIACGPPARIGAASFSTAASSSSGGATASTSPQASAVGGVDHLAGQQQLARPAPADQLRQQRRLDDRGDADPDLRHAEHRPVAGDAQVAGGGEFQPGAEREAVDARDDRHRQAPAPVAAAMHQRDEVARAVAVERRDLADIGAADKGALAGPGQDRRAAAPGRRRAASASRRYRPSARG